MTRGEARRTDANRNDNHRHSSVVTMPVQSAFTLLIIGGAFSATGGLLMALNYLEHGNKRRPVVRDYWGHMLRERDSALVKLGAVDRKDL